jgi:large subunit ribosomal protein L20
MVRVTRGNVAAKRRKKVLKLAKGFVGANSKLSTYAGEQIVQSLNFSYIGRRLKKRSFRRNWIYRINVASRINQNTYSKILGALRNLDILLNRKSLSSIAFTDLAAFNVLAREAKKSNLYT